MPGTPRSYGAGSNLLPKPAGLGLCQASRAASGYGSGQQLSCRSCPGLADSVWFLPGGACQQQAGQGEASHPGGFWRRRGSVSRAFWHSCCHLPLLAGWVCAVGTSSVLQGGQFVGGASLLCFPPSPAVSRSSPCSFTAFALSACTSPPLRVPAPRLCACLPSPGCVRVFLTDCAISVCPYLSLTRTTKQRYAHLFFLRVCLLLGHLSLPWEGSGAEHPAAGSVPSAGTEPRPCVGLCCGQQGCCALPPPGVVKTWPAVLAEQVRGALRGQPGVRGRLLGCCGGVS